ncbi:glycosyltransferase, partial [Staphylococcus epidermidis]|nr:glycosyltransferase [Staphylococcus epidermidis]
IRYNVLNHNKNRNNQRSNDLYKLSSFYKVKTYRVTYASNYSQDEGFKERVH